MELPSELGSYHKEYTRNNFKFVRKDLLVNHFNVVILQLSNPISSSHSSRLFELQEQEADSLFTNLIIRFFLPSNGLSTNKISLKILHSIRHIRRRHSRSCLFLLFTIAHLSYKSLCNHFFHIIVSRLVHITHQIHQSR